MARKKVKAGGGKLPPTVVWGQGVCSCPGSSWFCTHTPPPQSEPPDTLPSCLSDLLISFCSTATGHKLIVIHLDEQLILKKFFRFLFIELGS